jgi:hypothetical protein
MALQSNAARQVDPVVVLLERVEQQRPSTEHSTLTLGSSFLVKTDPDLVERGGERGIVTDVRQRRVGDTIRSFSWFVFDCGLFCLVMLWSDTGEKEIIHSKKSSCHSDPEISMP